uniref:Uncharacterized protein n=1 Tax=Anguilla anguilla TaxID=7936 RepID=A0A0E9UZ63_ANGAN
MSNWSQICTVELCGEKSKGQFFLHCLRCCVLSQVNISAQVTILMCRLKCVAFRLMRSSCDIFQNLV